jgi:hypothetical protein
MGRQKNTIAHLMKRTSVHSETGCWEWTGHLHRTGYGMASYNGKFCLVHRVFYSYFKGPINSHQPLDHLCRNPRCVNPEHLEQVSQRENTRRGLSTKLTSTTVENIRNEYLSGDTMAEISKRRGISESHICQIVRGISWGDAEGPIVACGRGRPHKGRRKITDEDVDCIRNLRNVGVPRLKVAAKYGIRKEAVSRICAFVGCYKYRGITSKQG